MLCGFSAKESLFYRIWNRKAPKVVGSRNATFIETPPHDSAADTTLSTSRVALSGTGQQHASPDDLLRDARDYTVVLAFNVNIPAKHTNVESVGGGPEIEQLLRQIRDVTRKDCLYSERRPRILRLGETHPGKVRPGKNFQRHICRHPQRSLIRPVNRHSLRYHQERWRGAPRV